MQIHLPRRNICVLYAATRRRLRIGIKRSICIFLDVKEIKPLESVAETDAAANNPKGKKTKVRKALKKLGATSTDAIAFEDIFGASTVRKYHVVCTALRYLVSISTYMA